MPAPTFGDVLAAIDGVKGAEAHLADVVTRYLAPDGLDPAAVAEIARRLAGSSTAPPDLRLKYPPPPPPAP